MIGWIEKKLSQCWDVKAKQKLCGSLEAICDAVSQCGKGVLVINTGLSLKQRNQ